MRLLLTSVFGPFGVDDNYGRKSNKMELFHNQVTREQGLFSYRFNHNSFGLTFLAENVDTPTTVLDFPSLNEFKKEIQKGYDYIGISFIVPNFKKAQKMAWLIRELAPHSKIILGGHGTSTPQVELCIDHDYICRGEGVRFLRQVLGENPDRPITHPVQFSAFNRSLMGVPLPQDSGVLVPGVGCANKCRFCATSHFFGEYTPYLKTGQDMYDVCLRYERELNVTDFGVLDENFLKMPERAFELIHLIEKNKKYFTFSIFSSAETLTALPDLDLLVRMGVQLIWLGVESKKEVYEKNKGIDLQALIAALKIRGISTLASAILFLEHHDQKTIWDDVDYAISLKPDYLQFMQLGPMPGTALYNDYENKDLLLKNIPHEEKHGQDQIWFHHPHFNRSESRDFIKMAFARDYAVNGVSLLRQIQTALQGYRYTSQHSDPLVRVRAKDRIPMLKQVRYFMPAIAIFANGTHSRHLFKTVRSEFKTIFPARSIKDKLLPLAVLLLSFKEFMRITFWNDDKPIRSLYLHYRMGRPSISLNSNPTSEEVKVTA